MRAVIFAAGRGERMGALTADLPKPLLRIAGKSLLDLKIEALPPEVDEVVIVIGYLGEKIVDSMGSSAHGKKISYVVQNTFLGTADALWQTKSLVGERFIAMNGDDIYDPEDILRCLSFDQSMLVSKVDSLTVGGKVKLDSVGCVTAVEEGSDHGGDPGLVNAGLYVLRSDIFRRKLVQIPGRTEYGLPQTLLNGDSPETLFAVIANRWVSITSPSDLAKEENARRGPMS